MTMVLYGVAHEMIMLWHLVYSDWLPLFIRSHSGSSASGPKLLIKEPPDCENDFQKSSLFGACPRILIFRHEVRWSYLIVIANPETEREHFMFKVRVSCRQSVWQFPTKKQRQVRIWGLRKSGVPFPL